MHQVHKITDETDFRKPRGYHGIPCPILEQSKKSSSWIWLNQAINSYIPETCCSCNEMITPK